MKALTKVIVPIAGDKTGKSVFNFELGNSFFESIEDAAIDSAQVKLKLEMDKRTDMMLFDFHFGGTVETICDRCADDLDLPIKGKERVIVKFLADNEKPLPVEINDETEVQYIRRGETELDFSQLFYEFVVISMPLKRAHPLKPKAGQKGCDKNVLKFLGMESEMNEPEEDEAPTNSLFSALKKAMDEKEKK